MTTNTLQLNELLNQFKDMSTEDLAQLLKIKEAMDLIGKVGLGASTPQPTTQSHLRPQLESNQEVMEFFFEKLKENRRSDFTILTYRNALEPYLKWLGSKKVSDITFRDALAYIRHLRREEDGVRVYEASTINNRHSALSSFYDFLQDTMKYVDTNYYTKKHIQQLPEEEINIEVTYLTQEQIERFLTAIVESPNNRGTLSRIRDYVMYRLMMTSGLRIGEVTQLTFEDLDFEAGVLTVRNEIAKKGKGRQTKLDKDLEVVMGKYLEEREKLGVQSDILFLNQEGNPINPNRSLRAIKRYAKEAGLWNPGAPITNHTLRHTFATMMIARGESLTQVSKMLGHASTDFSYKHYISNNVAEVKADIFEGLFDNVPTIQ